MVLNVTECLKHESIEQYRKEERALIAKRLVNSQKRYRHLIKCMRADHLSTPAKFNNCVANSLITGDVKFKNVRTMGGILNATLDFVKRNYQHH